MDDSDKHIEVSASPDGKLLQPYGTGKYEPKVVFEKLTAIIRKKNPAWGRLFRLAVEKKEPGAPMLCWLRCLQCEDFLSPSNVSRAYDSHQTACRALKRQALHVPFLGSASSSASGNASGSVSQRLSFGAASGRCYWMRSGTRPRSTA